MQIRWFLLCFVLAVAVLEVSGKRGGGRTRLKVAPSSRQQDTRRRKDKNRNQYSPPTAPPPPPPPPAPKPAAKPAPKPQASAPPVGPPAPAPVPSAPVMPSANKPNQPIQAQNYPQQSASNPNFQQQGAPPAYQNHAVPPAGAPPAYSPHGSPPAYPSNVAPPAYSPHGSQPAGFQQPNGAPPAYQGPHIGFQQPAAGQHGAGIGHGAPGYSAPIGQQGHGYPTNQGYPAGHNAPAGYPAGYGAPGGYPAGHNAQGGYPAGYGGAPGGYPAGYGGAPGGYPAGYGGAPGGYPAGYGNPGGYAGAAGLGAAHGIGGGYGSHGGGFGGGGYGSNGYGGYGKQKHGSSMLSNAGLLLTGAAVGALAHRGLSGGFGYNRNSYHNRQEVLSCPEYDFKTLADCCETLPENLFSEDAMLACNNNTKDKALFTVANHYIMNKIQNPLDADSLMVKDTPQACFTRCLFKNQNLLSEDNTIDYEAASKYFVSRVDSSWQSVISGAMTSCKTSIPIGITNETLYAPAECDNAPGFLLQCIRRKLLRYCPGDKLDKSYKCVQNMYVLRKCSAFWNTVRKEEPMIGNGTDVMMNNNTMIESDNTTLLNSTMSEDFNETMSDSAETTTEKLTTIIIPSTLKPRVSYSIEEIERMLAGGPPPTKTPPTTTMAPTTMEPSKVPIMQQSENSTMEVTDLMGNSTVPIVIGEFKVDQFNMTMDQMLLELSDFDDED